MGDAERRTGAFEPVLEEALAPRGGGDDVTGEENATPLVGDSEVALVVAAAEAAAAGLDAVASSFFAGASVDPATALRQTRVIFVLQV